MKSRNALRKRREATRIEWTPSGLDQSSAASRQLTNSSNLVTSTNFMPAVAGALHLIRIRFALAIGLLSLLGLLAANAETQCSFERLFEQFALSFRFEQFIFAVCLTA